MQGRDGQRKEGRKKIGFNDFFFHKSNDNTTCTVSLTSLPNSLNQISSASCLCKLMCKKYRVQLSWGIAILSKTNLTGSDRWSLVIRILDGWNNNVPNLLGYPVNHTLHHLPTHSSQLPIWFAWLTRLCLNEGFQL